MRVVVVSLCGWRLLLLFSAAITLGNHWPDARLPRQNHPGAPLGDEWSGLAQRLVHVQHRGRAHRHFPRLLLHEVSGCGLGVRVGV